MAMTDFGSTTGRRFFRLDEHIPMRVRADTDPVEVVLAAEGGRKLRLLCPACGGWAHFTIAARGLSAGEWTLSAGDRHTTITVTPAVDRTLFSVAVFQANLDSTKPPWCELEMPIDDRIAALRDDYGVNVLLWWYLNGWVPPEQPKLSEPRDPHVRPETIDRITRTEARFFQLNTVARMHQPGGPDVDWSDDAGILSCRYTVKLAAQRGRPFGGFMGVHIADEPGLTHGVMHEDGRCTTMGESADGTYAGPLAVPAQRRKYEELTGRAAPHPLPPGEDLANWLDFMRWRTTILGEVFDVLSRDIHAVDAGLISTSQLYAWEAMIDGVYIRDETRGADLVCTHAYPDRHIGAWYPAHETDAIRAGSWDKPMWMIPAWAGCASAGGIRAAAYSTLARKVEGLIWSLDSMMTWPQAKEVMQKILPISGMLALTQKPRDPVAIFFSREQMLFDLSRDPQGQGATGKEYVGRLNAAWLAAAAAHYPAGHVIEEDLANGVAAVHPVIVVPGLTHVPQSVVEALEHYIDIGGAVLLDAASTVDVRGAERLPFAFPNMFEAQKMSDRMMFDSLVAPHVQALADALASYADPVAECDNAEFLLSRQEADAGAYLWVVNMAEAQPKDAKDGRWNHVPARGTVTLPARFAAAYDVFAGKRIAEDKVDLALDGGDAAIFALMPAAIERIAVDRASFELPYLEVGVRVEGAGMCIDAIIPLSIDIEAPSGRPLRTLHRATQHGRFFERILIGGTPVAGEWHITVTELLSGTSATATALVAPAGGCLFGTPSVEVIDAVHVAKALRPEKGEILVIADGVAFAAAERLASALNARGRSARADHTHVHMQNTVDVHDSIWPLEQPPLAIHKQVVLLGDTQSNALMARLVDDYLLCPRLIDDACPGPGRALVWWATAVFGLDSDIVAVYGTDRAGIDAGVDAVARLAD